jgi:hypothetical protein
MKNGLAQVVDIPIQTPGPYQLRAAVMDQATKLTGSSAQFVFIPDVKSKQLAMSDVTIATEAFVKAQSEDGAPALRVVRGGDKLIYGAFLYNVKGAKPNIEAQVVLYRDGKAVYTGKKTAVQPVDHTEGKPVTITGTLNLAPTIAAGEYLLQVAVRDLDAPKKFQFAVRSTDFEVRTR